MIPKVSVIIPTHNRAQMLKRAVDSVLAQTYQDFEVIVVSDGSTDNTDEVVSSYIDPRIVYSKHGKSRGASAARNTGIRASRGKFVAFLDDDDEWLPHKLELQVPVIEKSSSEVGLVYAWMEYFENGKSTGIRSPKIKGNIFVKMLERQAISGCPTIIMKKKVVDKVGFFDENLPRGNDGDYWRRVCKHYYVDFVPEVLVEVHTGHRDRISVNSDDSLRNHIKAAKLRLSRFEEDFKNYPDAEAKVLWNIVKTHMKLRDRKNALSVVLKIMRLLNINLISWLKFMKKL